jgi:hypothetical protein
MAINQVRIQVADILWNAMRIDPAFNGGGTGPMRIWRESVYPGLVRRQMKAMHAHRNPEPWLTLNCTMQALSGDGFQRDARRYQGIVGGRTTELEYQAIARGEFTAPLVVLGGFPRSGTTSLQTLLRTIYPSHIPEIATEEQRFSLWEYPKHDVAAMTELSQCSSKEVHVVIASRRFEDAAASLAVGRGSLDLVDLELKITRWKAWMRLALSGCVVSVPFEAISALTPQDMAESLAVITELPLERHLSFSDTYVDLMGASGKGDTVNPRQSNTPSNSRVEELSQVRDQVVKKVGQPRIDELGRLYDQVRSSGMSAFGTVDPA